MLERVKISGATGMGSIYFICTKMNLGDQRVECYGLKYVPQNSYVEALTPIATLFGDRAFKEILAWDSNPIGLLSPTQRRDHVRTQ